MPSWLNRPSPLSQDMLVSYHEFSTTSNLTIAISDKHFLFIDGVEADPESVKLGQVEHERENSSHIHAGAYMT